MRSADELVQIVAGRNVNGRPVRVRKLRPGDPIAGLHVLFVGRADGGRLAEILAAAKGQALLTVTESGRRARAGQHDQFRGGRGQGAFRTLLLPVRIEQPENQRAPARSRAQSRVEIVVKLPSLRSLRQKLLGMMLLTTLVALIVALAAIIGYDLNAYHRILVSDMTTQAELLGARARRRWHSTTSKWRRRI